MLTYFPHPVTSRFCRVPCFSSSRSAFSCPAPRCLAPMPNSSVIFILLSACRVVAQVILANEHFSVSTAPNVPAGVEVFTLVVDWGRVEDSPSWDYFSLSCMRTDGPLLEYGPLHRLSGNVVSTPTCLDFLPTLLAPAAVRWCSFPPVGVRPSSLPSQQDVDPRRTPHHLICTAGRYHVNCARARAEKYGWGTTCCVLLRSNTCPVRVSPMPLGSWNFHSWASLRRLQPVHAGALHLSEPSHLPPTPAPQQVLRLIMVRCTLTGPCRPSESS